MTEVSSNPETPQPDRCGCLEDPERGGRPMGAYSRFLLRALAPGGPLEPDDVGGPDVVAMLKAHPTALWCLGCGGRRDDG